MKRIYFLLSVFVLGCGSPQVALEQESMTVEATQYTHPVLGGVLTVYSMDVQNGIRGIYERDGQSITFQTKRGEESSQWLAGDDEAPMYEIDVQFLDEFGAVYLTQTGGHEYIDPSWKDDDNTVEVEGYVDHGHRMRSFMLTLEAMDVIGQVEFPKEVSWEKNALYQLGSHAMVREPDQSHFDDWVVEVVPPQGDTITKATWLITCYDYVTSTSATHAGSAWQTCFDNTREWHCGVQKYSHRASIYAKSFLVSGMAEHSASARYRECYVCDANIFRGVHCNHGTCAYTDPMAYKYGKDYKPRYYAMWGENGCWTDYSILYDNGRHVCNDDTGRQAWDVKWDYFGDRYDGTCGDTTLRRYAPSYDSLISGL